MSSEAQQNIETTFRVLLGASIAQIRKMKEIDQGKLAEAVGVTQSTWSRIENGQSALTVDQLAIAAEFLGTKLSDLLHAVESVKENLEKKGISTRYAKSMEELAGIPWYGAPLIAALAGPIGFGIAALIKGMLTDSIKETPDKKTDNG